MTLCLCPLPPCSGFVSAQVRRLFLFVILHHDKCPCTLSRSISSACLPTQPRGWPLSWRRAPVGTIYPPILSPTDPHESGEISLWPGGRSRAGAVTPREGWVPDQGVRGGEDSEKRGQSQASHGRAIREGPFPSSLLRWNPFTPGPQSMSVLMSYFPASMGDTESSPGAHLGATLMRGKDRALKGGHKEEERALG